MNQLTQPCLSQRSHHIDTSVGSLSKVTGYYRARVSRYAKSDSTFQLAQDEIARIRKLKRGRNMLNRSGNTTDNLCFRYRFRNVFSRFRCCVYNGTGPLRRKHNGNMELHVSATFQKYGNM